MFLNPRFFLRQKLFNGLQPHPARGRDLHLPIGVRDLQIEVFNRLEGIYGIKIGFDKEAFSKCSVTAHFNNENLYQKLDIICEIVRAKYEVIDGEIMIFGNGCQ